MQRNEFKFCGFSRDLMGSVSHLAEVGVLLRWYQCAVGVALEFGSILKFASSGKIRHPLRHLPLLVVFETNVPFANDDFGKMSPTNQPDLQFAVNKKGVRLAAQKTLRNTIVSNCLPKRLLRSLWRTSLDPFHSRHSRHLTSPLQFKEGKYESRS
jgi:hypothetical protein